MRLGENTAYTISISFVRFKMWILKFPASNSFSAPAYKTLSGSLYYIIYCKRQHRITLVYKRVDTYVRTMFCGFAGKHRKNRDNRFGFASAPSTYCKNNNTIRFRMKNDRLIDSYTFYSVTRLWNARLGALLRSFNIPMAVVIRFHIISLFARDLTFT